jgi:hypothetical protein
MDQSPESRCSQPNTLIRYAALQLISSFIWQSSNDIDAAFFYIFSSTMIQLHIWPKTQQKNITESKKINKKKKNHGLQTIGTPRSKISCKDQAHY